MINAQKKASARYWLNQYCETTNIVEAAAIMGQMTQYGASQVQAQLRKNSWLYGIPLYGLKSGGLSNHYILRVETDETVEFVEVTSNPKSF